MIDKTNGGIEIWINENMTYVNRSVDAQEEQFKKVYNNDGVNLKNFKEPQWINGDKTLFYVEYEDAAKSNVLLLDTAG